MECSHCRQVTLSLVQTTALLALHNRSYRKCQQTGATVTYTQEPNLTKHIRLTISTVLRVNRGQEGKQHCEACEAPHTEHLQSDSFWSEGVGPEGLLNFPFRVYEFAGGGP